MREDSLLKKRLLEKEGVSPESCTDEAEIKHGDKEGQRRKEPFLSTGGVLCILP